MRSASLWNTSMWNDAWAQLGFNPYHPSVTETYIPKNERRIMPEDTTYNGWTNRDTWAANMWLTGNDETTYRFAIGAAHDVDPMPRLMALIDELGNPDEINYTNVNWQEVIDALKEE